MAITIISLVVSLDKMTNEINIKLLIEFAQTSNVVLTHNHVLSLISAVTRVFPGEIDNHSKHVFEDLISVTVPCLLSRTDDVEKLLKIYIDIFPENIRESYSWVNIPLQGQWSIDNEDDDYGAYHMIQNQGITFMPMTITIQLAFMGDKSSEDHRKTMKNIVEGQLLQVENLTKFDKDGQESWLDIITVLSYKAATLLKPYMSRGGRMDFIGYVKVKCIACGLRNERACILFPLSQYIPFEPVF
ncbi:hypothetical protein RJT34_12572 [Clitoria ternatea]|uniref:Uncharacterized protein n=1 Tax=Clitoria ternatea TaxID=43366 RepID=A0AAN9PJF8_CLITE